MLDKVNAAAVERALLAWQAQVLGPAQDDLVIVDGKEIRHSKVELVSTVNGKGRWLGTVSVAEGSHEIPAARVLLTKVDVSGKRVLADALHTQTETAQQILYEGGGDYLLTVKGNQKAWWRPSKDGWPNRLSPLHPRRRRTPSRGNTTTGGRKCACWTAAR